MVLSAQRVINADKALVGCGPLQPADLHRNAGKTQPNYTWCAGALVRWCSFVGLGAVAPQSGAWGNNFVIAWRGSNP